MKLTQLIVSSLLPFLALASGAFEEAQTTVRRSDVCDPDLPNLTVAKENLIHASEWPQFVKKNPFFVLGLTDSSCVKCCESEPLLAYLKEKTASREFTYPHKDPKKKKIIRKEIPIVRVDLGDRTQSEQIK